MSTSSLPGQPEYPGQPAAWPDMSPWKKLAQSFGAFGKSRLRREALELLIDASALPGTGWRELNTSSSRVGMGAGSKESAAKRARATGEFSAIRRFRTEQPEPGRGVMVQVLPTASVADAQAQVQVMPSSIVRWSDIKTHESRTLDSIEVPFTDSVLVWERLNEREGYGRGYSRSIAANVGRRVLLISCSGMGAGCEWGDVVLIASAQARRLHESGTSEEAS